MSGLTLARLGLAGWAARAFATYDQASVRWVVAAAGEAGGLDGGLDAAFDLDPDLEPVGVVVALTDSVAATVTVVGRALATGNAVLVCPQASAFAAVVPVVRAMGDAAVAAGAPLGLVSIVDDASPSTVDVLRADPRVDLVIGPAGPVTPDVLRRVPEPGRTRPVRRAPSGAVPAYPLPSKALPSNALPANARIST